MMAKGYSVKEQDTADAGLPGGGKVQGVDPPRPPEAVATATTALLTLLAPPNATRVTLATTTPNAPLALAELAGGW